MGIIFSKIHSFLTTQKIRLCVIGLDMAGKTSIVYQLRDKIGLIKEGYPCINNSLSPQEYENAIIQELDLNFQDKLLPLFRIYFEQVEGVIFVLDCNYSDGFQSAKDGLNRFMTKLIDKKLPLLVFANKQDLCIHDEHFNIGDILDLANVVNVANWKIQKCSAITKEGLKEGYDWMVSQLRQ